MAIYVGPHNVVGRDGGSFQECDMDTSTHTVIRTYGRYCTIRDNEYAPPTSVAGGTGCKFSEHLIILSNRRQSPSGLF